MDQRKLLGLCRQKGDGKKGKGGAKGESNDGKAPESAGIHEQGPKGPI